MDAVLVLGWVAGAWLLWTLPSLGRRGSPARVSVIVPARDEEARLPSLLRSLGEQRPPPFEVIVVDDSSRDGTAELARASGARVILAAAPPEGWAGKPWACEQGAAAAGGDVLVFLDADVVLTARDVLARLAAEVEDRHGLVSVQPRHLTRRAYEQLSAYFNVVALMGVDAFSPLRDRVRPSGAYGACLACARADYARAGGHASVRGDVLDDVALSRRFSRIGLFAGRSDVGFQMYPGGLAQLLEGWSKNIAAGAVAVRPLTAALVTLWITASLVAAAQPLAYAAYAAQLAWMLARLGRFAWATPLLFPLPLAFFVTVFAHSCLLAFVRGRVAWRGRWITVRRG